jgi:hypothetical protein
MAPAVLHAMQSLRAFGAESRRLVASALAEAAQPAQTGARR